MPAIHNKHQLRAFFQSACFVELEALKPGNVHLYAPGHAMTLEHFVISARLSAPCLTDYPLGEGVLKSAQAVQRHVGCNVNLGIVLLCAPLICAALTCPPNQTFKSHLAQTLAAAGKSQCQSIMDAISLAKPAGLGKVKTHDVHQKAAAPLKEVMAHAQDHDLIAYQYANDFIHVFEYAARFNMLLAIHPLHHALTFTFMHLLAHHPDSHIRRKHGADCAQKVQEKARALYAALNNDGYHASRTQLLAWDKELKRKHINPGTSADFIVASHLLYAITHLVTPTLQKFEN